MESNDEMFYGKESAEANKAFKNALLTIETDYQAYFQSKEARDSTEKHQRLTEHCVTKYDGYNVEFGFKPHSDLPEHIKEQCLQAFAKHFSPKSK